MGLDEHHAAILAAEFAAEAAGNHHTPGGPADVAGDAAATQGQPTAGADVSDSVSPEEVDTDEEFEEHDQENPHDEKQREQERRDRDDDPAAAATAAAAAAAAAPSPARREKPRGAAEKDFTVSNILRQLQAGRPAEEVHAVRLRDVQLVYTSESLSSSESGGGGGRVKPGSVMPAHLVAALRADPKVSTFLHYPLHVSGPEEDGPVETFADRFDAADRSFSSWSDFRAFVLAPEPEVQQQQQQEEDEDEEQQRQRQQEEEDERAGGRGGTNRNTRRSRRPRLAAYDDDDEFSSPAPVNDRKGRGGGDSMVLEDVDGEFSFE